MRRILDFATLLLLSSSMAAAGALPATVNASRAHAHDNYFTMQLASGLSPYSISFSVETHYITGGQPFDGVSTSQPDQLDVKAGRKGSSSVAAQFASGLQPTNMMVSWPPTSTANPPGELNFAIVGSLVLNMPSGTVVCPNMLIGQGHALDRNNWWVASAGCSGQGGTTPLTCSCCEGSAPCATPKHIQIAPAALIAADLVQVREEWPTVCGGIAATACGADNSCCIDADNGQPFCVPGPNATCCNWHTNTCPAGTSCDPPANACNPPPPPGSNTSLECSACKAVVNKALSKGCDEACAILGPFEDLCTLLMDHGLCAYILEKLNLGQQPADICEMVGACGAHGTCICGYCQPAFYGQWCLSLPNHCPAGSVVAADAKDSSESIAHPRSVRNGSAGDAHRLDQRSPWAWKPAGDVAPDVKDVGPFRGWRIPHRSGTGARAGGDDCVDHVCEAAKQGCCLTCAP